MNRSTVRLVVTAALVVMQVPANAQPTAQRLRRPSHPSMQQNSRFYIQGPNAPFQNQLRKMTDPLGANGAGR